MSCAFYSIFFIYIDVTPLVDETGLYELRKFRYFFHAVFTIVIPGKGLYNKLKSLLINI